MAGQATTLCASPPTFPNYSEKRISFLLSFILSTLFLTLWASPTFGLSYSFSEAPLPTHGCLCLLGLASVPSETAWFPFLFSSPLLWIYSWPELVCIWFVLNSYKTVLELLLSSSLNSPINATWKNKRGPQFPLCLLVNTKGTQSCSNTNRKVTKLNITRVNKV